MRMNLSEAISTWASRRGDALALTGSHNLTYKELDNYASIYAQRIMAVIPYSPKKIAILAHDNISFISFLLGIIRSGNVFVLINPTLSTEQINKSLDAIHCEYYISHSPQSDINAKYVPLSDLHTICTDRNPKIVYPNIGITADAGIIFSSGTTGEPKALMRNSYSILSETIQWIIELQLQIGTSFLIPRPLYYTGGFILMYASLFSGGRVDLLDDISCKNILDYVQNVSVDWAFIVPSVIREMNATTYSHMAKNVLTMGSPIFHSEKIAFYEKFKCNLIEVWGNSEGLGTITKPSDLFEHPFSIGRPFFTDYLNVINNEDQISKHNEGLIFGISDNEFSEYIGQPELTRSVLHDGYIYSEDVGYKDSDGYFYITGRIKEIIVVNGIKVFPSDIEKELLSTGKVLDCAVFSTSDDNGNDVVSVALVMKEGYIPNEVVCDINLNLAPHERIHRYMLFNAIPRNHGGKIDRNALMVSSVKIYEV